MAADVEAVIAALRVALDEAQNSDATYWKSEAANRWIGQLPGAWSGRWRRLKIHADASGEVYHEEFVGHVRAALASKPPVRRYHLRANGGPCAAAGAPPRRRPNPTHRPAPRPGR